jgi:hypothetical protein
VFSHTGAAVCVVCVGIFCPVGQQLLLIDVWGLNEKSIPYETFSNTLHFSGSIVLVGDDVWLVGGGV